MERLQGLVEQITYHALQTGFVVLQVQIKQQREGITVVGELPGVSVGDLIDCLGEWVNDSRHGLQFQAHEVTITPVSMAVDDVVLFLQSYGIGTTRAMRVVKLYGADTVRRVRENPYCLVTEGADVAFHTVDQLAKQLGVAHDSLLRAEAGVCYVLQKECLNGHCALPNTQLIAACHRLLGLPMALIEQAINQAIRRGHLVQDELNHEPCVYLEALYRAELSSARHLKRLNQGTPPWGKLDVNACVEWVETQGNVVYSASQRQALHALLQAKCAIITGGPGVGKTTMISSVLMIAQSNQLQVALCAPTGRAAKRLSETTHWPAKTLHRLLQYEAESAVFKHNQANLLPVDVVIVDEASMVDVVLMDHFLAAVPSHAAVIWVGDCDQLPSVGSGAVLADLIASGVITTVRLAEIFRQSARSAIITNAYRVNQGELPLPNAGKNSDFFTIYAQTPEEIYHRLLEVVCQRLPKFYACDPMKDIQVLTPMNRGTLGSRAINLALQRQLNGNETVNVSRLGTTFLRGDKIIQLTNNYEKEVFNGDMGIIHHIDAATGHVMIQFDQTLKEYTFHELGEISLAYAISIHKSQGSEFPVVVIPLATQHYMLLARNVLYTGMTRGKQCVVLIGQKKAVEKAVSNDKASRRYTNLAARLRDLSDHVV